MKHTAGPWEVTRPSVMNGVQIIRCYDYPMTSETICTMPQRGKGRTANARLIAASPDLLEAAKSIIEWTNEEGRIDDKVLLIHIRNAARAALAKAEG
jgi:hypothetical protein